MVKGDKVWGSEGKGEGERGEGEAGDGEAGRSRETGREERVSTTAVGVVVVVAAVSSVAVVDRVWVDRKGGLWMDAEGVGERVGLWVSGKIYELVGAWMGWWLGGFEVRSMCVPP